MSCSANVVELGLAEYCFEHICRPPFVTGRKAILGFGQRLPFRLGQAEILRHQFRGRQRLSAVLEEVLGREADGCRVLEPQLRRGEDGGKPVLEGFVTEGSAVAHKGDRLVQGLKLFSQLVDGEGFVGGEALGGDRRSPGKWRCKPVDTGVHDGADNAREPCVVAGEGL